MRKIKFKKKTKIICLCLILVVLCLGALLFLDYRKKAILKKDKALAEEKLVKEIKDSYSKFVSIKSGSTLYNKDGNKYVQILKIDKEKDFTLADTEINKDTKYFYVEELGYYVRYQDVFKVSSLVTFP